MKTILVAVDYSPNAVDALRYTLPLARATGAQIVVLHAFHLLLSVPYTFHEMVAQLEREETAKLIRFTEEVRAEFDRAFIWKYRSTFSLSPEERRSLPVAKSRFHSVQEERFSFDTAALRVKCLARPGRAADVITQEAKAHQASLVVMGARGGGAMSQALLGSTLLETVQHSRVPVVAVPPGWLFKGVRSITFATDLLRMPQRSKLNTLHELVKAFGATLRVLHFYNSNDTWTERREAAPALEKLDSYFYDLDFDVYFLYQPDLISSLSHFISEYKTDLLVLRTQKHRFFERLFTRSMAERAVSHLSVPLLLLPDRS